ncbi:hypothetical protein HS125_06175 [bacterium]|nr:hypothetical protein [bacterium]
MSIPGGRCDTWWTGIRPKAKEALAKWVWAPPVGVDARPTTWAWRNRLRLSSGEHDKSLAVRDEMSHQVSWRAT